MRRAVPWWVERRLSECVTLLQFIKKTKYVTHVTSLSQFDPDEFHLFDVTTVQENGMWKFEQCWISLQKNLQCHLHYTITSCHMRIVAYDKIWWKIVSSGLIIMHQLKHCIYFWQPMMTLMMKLQVEFNCICMYSVSARQQCLRSSNVHVANCIFNNKFCMQALFIWPQVLPDSQDFFTSGREQCLKRVSWNTESTHVEQYMYHYCISTVYSVHYSATWAGFEPTTSCCWVQTSYPSNIDIFLCRTEKNWLHNADVRRWKTNLGPLLKSFPQCRNRPLSSCGHSGQILWILV